LWLIVVDRSKENPFGIRKIRDLSWNFSWNPMTQMPAQISILAIWGKVAKIQRRVNATGSQEIFHVRENLGEWFPPRCPGMCLEPRAPSGGQCFLHWPIRGKNSCMLTIGGC